MENLHEKDVMICLKFINSDLLCRTYFSTLFNIVTMMVQYNTLGILDGISI